jgi:alanyl-tRNA synthetase
MIKLFSMDHYQLRNLFINFFQNKKHILMSPSSLIPINDNSIFFTNAGMNQFKQYFTLEKLSPYERIVTIQPCVRAGGKHNDLDNVGFTKRHHTFFEMMGNFSFYNYFKEEAINYALEFLLQELNLPEDKFFFTLHKKDIESFHILKKYTKRPIILLDDADNFWSMGDLGPCGYCAEIYYYIGDQKNPTAEDFLSHMYNPNPDFLEIWNLVFMEFNKTPTEQILLEKKSIDTGIGLERILSILEGTFNNYQTSLFTPLIKFCNEELDIYDNIACIVADHLKSVVFLLNTGLRFGNEGREYVIRKILRRALTYVNSKIPKLYKLASCVQKIYANIYNILDIKEIETLIHNEEVLFLHTIQEGFQRLQDNFTKQTINEELVFQLYETYGLPLSFSKVFLEQKGINLNNNIIEKLQDHHKQISGQVMNIHFNYITQSIAYNSLETEAQVLCLIVNNQLVDEVNIENGNNFICITNITPFYARGGGQEGDQGVIVYDDMKINILNTTKTNKTIIHHCKLLTGFIRNNDKIHMKVDDNWRKGTTIHHSATHILHRILQIHLGKVLQKGSYITYNKLRFDFNFDRALTKDEKTQIENMACEVIQANLKINVWYIPLSVAKAHGAEMLENTDYEEQVRVISIGDENQKLSFFSFVLCGGIHAHHTSDLKNFVIISEKSIGKGIRRLEVQCNQ